MCVRYLNLEFIEGKLDYLYIVVKDSYLKREKKISKLKFRDYKILIFDFFGIWLLLEIKFM